MTNENMLEVSANDGKYTIIVDCEHKTTVLRYGDPWPAFASGRAPDNLTMALAWDLAEARGEVANLRVAVADLEKLRPHWAKGYTSDGVAAQCATSAMQSLWDLLGAKNQTDAMEKLRALVAGDAA